MELRWDGPALMFLVSGAWLGIVAVANVAKYINHLTSVGIVVYLVGGAVLTSVGVYCLLGFKPCFLELGFLAIGILLVSEGTGRLSIVPHSVTMQRILMVGGLILSGFLTFGLMAWLLSRLISVLL